MQRGRAGWRSKRYLLVPSVDTVHERMQIPRDVRKLLREAAAPDEGVPGRESIIADSARLWGPQSDRAVCADFDTVINTIEQSSKPLSKALEDAARAARLAGCLAVTQKIVAVEAQANRAKTLEASKHHALANLL